MDPSCSVYNSFFYINPNYEPYALPINQTVFYPNSNYISFPSSLNQPRFHNFSSHELQQQHYDITNRPLDYVAYPPRTSSDFIHQQQEFSFLEEETFIIDATQDDDEEGGVVGETNVIHRVENYNDDSLVFDHQEISLLGEEEETTIIDEDNSFEDSFLFEEAIVLVDSGLSVEIITKHVKNRNYVAATVTTDEEEGADICVICQSEYENAQVLGGLQCGHVYHQDCILRWLQEKNNCPVCKATAVS